MIVTLSGSTRFEHEFIKASRELNLNGILCFSLAVLPQHIEESESWDDGSFSKTMGDLLYFKRIIHSNALIVLGDGYIGASTSREILWANINNIPIFRHLQSSNWDDTCSMLLSYNRYGWKFVDIVKKFDMFFEAQYHLIERARKILGEQHIPHINKKLSELSKHQFIDRVAESVFETTPPEDTTKRAAPSSKRSITKVDRHDSSEMLNPFGFDPDIDV